jgi:hypothetical protein
MRAFEVAEGAYHSFTKNMGYYVRAFCKAAVTPSLAAIKAWLHERAPDVRFTEVADLQATDWTEVDLVYKSDRQPIIVECNRDGDPDSLVREEAAEFSEKIGKPGRSASKRRVLDHLAATKVIVACRLLSDIDDDGYEANYQFLSYFVAHCDGMIQADGEGFYDGDEIIVEV